MKSIMKLQNFNFTRDFIGKKFLILSTGLARGLFIIIQSKVAMCKKTHRELSCKTDGRKEPMAFFVRVSFKRYYFGFCSLCFHFCFHSHSLQY